MVAVDKLDFSNNLFYQSIKINLLTIDFILKLEIGKLRN
jgi:hypothetical protein